MILGIDVDSVVADLHTTWLRWYNRDYKDNLTLDEWTEWKVPDRVKCTDEEMSHYIRIPEIYDDVLPVEGSQANIELLKRLGHRIVYITSTPIGMEGVKYNWLRKWNFITSKKDYFEAEDKSLINTDILLDDRYENIRDFPKLGVLFRRPWNLKYKYLPVIYDWNSFYIFITDGIFKIHLDIKKEKIC